MSDATVTVAIPVLNGGPMLGETLDAVRRQRVDRELELLVADSGSIDGSRERAVNGGARVIDVPRGEFSHGGTRNLLMRESAGAHVAFLTQDAAPAGELWLQRLLEGFDMGEGVALVFGPYIPRPSASPMVRRELESMFASFAPDGLPRLDRAAPVDSGSVERDRRTFFTDANGCVSRRAWREVPFRAVAYAEDQLLARDMLASGWAKVYQPSAGVLHSHDYRPSELLRRAFDEARALREVHGQKAYTAPLSPVLEVQRHVRDDMALLCGDGLPAVHRPLALGRSLAHHTARAIGGTLGSRADRVPPRLRRSLSLERRDGFDPQC